MRKVETQIDEAATVKDLIFARLLTQLKVIGHEPITACQCSMQTPGTSVHESWTVTKKKVSWTVRYLSRFVCMPCCSIIRPNTNNHNKREHQHDVYEQALSTHGVLINENKL